MYWIHSFSKNYLPNNIMFITIPDHSNKLLVNYFGDSKSNKLPFEVQVNGTMLYLVTTIVLLYVLTMTCVQISRSILNSLHCKGYVLSKLIILTTLSRICFNNACNFFVARECQCQYTITILTVFWNFLDSRNNASSPP